MKDFGFSNALPVYVEVTGSLLRATRDTRQIEVPLERGADGWLTSAASDKATTALKTLTGKNVMAGKARALVAIPATGVIVRRLQLPAVPKEQIEQVLRLQIEAEFPLPPEELNYGWCALGKGIDGKQDLLVVAVKKAALANYIELFSACGLDASFTPAVLLRNQLAASAPGIHACLDVDAQRIEIATFEGGLPLALRQLPVTAAPHLVETVSKITGAVPLRKLYLSGSSGDMVTHYVKQLGQAFPCEALNAAPEASAAIAGLKKLLQHNAGETLPWLSERATVASSAAKPERNPEIKYWLKRAAVLIAVLLLLPYLEAFIFKPALARKLNTLKAEQSRLALIDNELDFLRSLKQTQPPYLDALYVLAKAAPPGTTFDTISMNGRGEMTLHGIFQSSTQVTDLRTKLIASGFFANVTVEEQTAVMGRPQLTVRMSALWKPLAERAALAIGPSIAEIQQAKTNHATAPMGGGGFPMGGMPVGAMRIRH